MKLGAKTPRSRGFTIVELVTVIILLGILSAVAMPRMMSANNFSPMTVSHQIDQELKLSQAIALSRSDAVISFQLQLQSGQWQLTTLSSVDGALKTVLVDQDATTIAVTDGVASANLQDGGIFSLQFNHHGDVSAANIGGNAAAINNGIQINTGGNAQRTLCVYPTGYVYHANCV